MKTVLAFVGIAVLMTSVAAADVNPSAARVLSPGSAGSTRANGTLGNTTITAQQVGALQVQLDASATTVGGDGVPVVVNWGGNTYALNNQVWVYGQIYDSPWNGGCTFWATPGPDWCAYGEQYFLNSPTPLGNFDVSFTTTVPAVGNYQTFVISRAGLTWITTGYNWFNTSQSSVHSVVQTIYIDSTQPPPTPTPGQPTTGHPVPTLSMPALLLLGALLAAVGVLMVRRA